MILEILLTAVAKCLVTMPHRHGKRSNRTLARTLVCDFYSALRIKAVANRKIAHRPADKNFVRMNVIGSGSEYSNALPLSVKDINVNPLGLYKVKMTLPVINSIVILVVLCDCYHVQ